MGCGASHQKQPYAMSPVAVPGVAPMQQTDPTALPAAAAAIGVPATDTTVPIPGPGTGAIPTASATKLISADDADKHGQTQKGKGRSVDALNDAVPSASGGGSSQNPKGSNNALATSRSTGALNSNVNTNNTHDAIAAGDGSKQALNANGIGSERNLKKSGSRNAIVNSKGNVTGGDAGPEGKVGAEDRKG
ncbi:uncharacterized protein EV422DRAFT_298374 [Fimicolochytrium jonesii]|uniref:uncharacterized protein n=1 Tax=Fimicolochytrium jonesii TaxID=1396493 RepID=UPI0022FF39E4|nr:uncharacterized protein EV422DRAFT_298374 [Fimicolochytrium jonesii]KAI8816205.1 hypothetical protein EV422DRAFT_298374 [Fimicolochytrium jonesii]